MLLESYTLEIFNSKCNPGAMAVRGARLSFPGRRSEKKLHDYMARFYSDDYEIIPG